jgi:hypothetical protein
MMIIGGITYGTGSKSNTNKETLETVGQAVLYSGVGLFGLSIIGSIIVVTYAFGDDVKPSVDDWKEFVKNREQSK